MPHYFDFPRLVTFCTTCGTRKRGFQNTHKKLEGLQMQGDNLHLVNYLSHEFNNHPTTEIWGPGVFNAAFHRLKLGHRIGIINQSQAEELYKDFGLLIEHLRKVAETGHKFNPQSGRAYGEAQLLINKYYFGGSQVYYNTDGYEKPLSAPNILTLFIPTIRALPAGFAKRLTLLQGLQRQYQQRQCTGENAVFSPSNRRMGATGQRVGKSIVTTVA